MATEGLNEEAIQNHVLACPIGYVRTPNEPTKLLSEGGTAEDYANWLDELEILVGLEGREDG